MNSSFEYNNASLGGAIYLGNSSFGQVDQDKWNVTFVGNDAAIAGHNLVE